MPTKCQQEKKFAAMTICHGLLQHTTQPLSFQSKSNELREAREVFFQWLSGHSQTGKWLVIRESLAYSLFIRLSVSKTLDAIGRANELDFYGSSTDQVSE